MAVLAVVSVVCLAPADRARAAEEWFVLAEQPLKTPEGIVEIKSQAVAGRRTSSRSGDTTERGVPLNRSSPNRLLPVP